MGGDTQNHIVLLDLRDQKITGKIASDALEQAGIIVNKNSIPFDVLSPFITSGIRMGSAACTTLGMREQEFLQIADFIHCILFDVKNNCYNINRKTYFVEKVRNLCSQF